MRGSAGWPAALLLLAVAALIGFAAVVHAVRPIDAAHKQGTLQHRTTMAECHQLLVDKCIGRPCKTVEGEDGKCEWKGIEPTAEGTVFGSGQCDCTPS